MTQPRSDALDDAEAALAVAAKALSGRDEDVTYALIKTIDAVTVLIEEVRRIRAAAGVAIRPSTASSIASRILSRSKPLPVVGEPVPATCADCEHGRQKMRDIICDKDGRCTPRGAPPPSWCPLRRPPPT